MHLFWLIALKSITKGYSRFVFIYSLGFLIKREVNSLTNYIQTFYTQEHRKNLYYQCYCRYWFVQYRNALSYHYTMGLKSFSRDADMLTANLTWISDISSVFLPKLPMRLRLQ